jgi:thioesterase domain-containing protein
VPDTVEAVASLYADQIRARQPHGPYHFISFCAGGPFAYEVARQLRSAGEEVGFLGFIDYPAPGQEIRSPFWSCYRYLCDNAGGAAAHLGRFARAGMGEKAASLLALPGFLAKKARNLPAEVATSPADVPGTDAAPAIAAAPYPEWIWKMGRVQQAVAMKNMDAVRRYRPAAYEGKVTIFLSRNLVRSGRRSGHYERTFGWKRLARGGVSRHVLGGDHYSIRSPDNFRLIAHIIRDGIDGSGGADNGHGR